MVRGVGGLKLGKLVRMFTVLIGLTLAVAVAVILVLDWVRHPDI